MKPATSLHGCVTNCRKVNTKRKTYETVKQELLNSLKEIKDANKPGLSEIANETKNPKEAILIICCYEDIMKTQH